MRILIVEDEVLIAMVAEEELVDAGHEVVGIATGFDTAVEMAARLRPDVALMDVRLSSARDGIDAATEVFLRFGIPSVIASGSVDATNVQRAAAARPVAWLVKPYTPQQLLAAVGKAGGPAPPDHALTAGEGSPA